jgi:hypothetical protein
MNNKAELELKRTEEKGRGISNTITALKRALKKAEKGEGSLSEFIDPIASAMYLLMQLKEMNSAAIMEIKEEIGQAEGITRGGA